ncbi:MAG: LysR family transcriptional regulator [Armatimonadetes bacterium]|nr:LysR family transcriptional regulator [Armatimonadota bacterium]
MNLSQLHQFFLVVEEGSVTRGAQRAAVSQPAISRAIADLEHALGTRLLDRYPKGVRPTEAGRLLADYGRRIFQLEREAIAALNDLQGLDAGSIQIGASTTIGDYLLPKAVSSFLTQYPKVKISLEVSNTEMIQQGVLDGRYDIGFTEGRVDSDKFETSVLAEDQLSVIAPPEHPLANRAVSLSDLAQYGFIMREHGSGTRRIVEEGFDRLGFNPTISCVMGSTKAVTHAVATGLGLGVVSTLALESEFREKAVIELQTPFRFTRQLHIVRLAGSSQSAAVRRFMEVLRSRFQ